VAQAYLSGVRVCWWAAPAYLSAVRVCWWAAPACQSAVRVYSWVAQVYLLETQQLGVGAALSAAPVCLWAAPMSLWAQQASRWVLAGAESQWEEQVSPSGA